MAKAGSRARRREVSQEKGSGVRHPWALSLPTVDPDVSNQMKRYGQSSAGTEEKVEARMKEAQRPWTTLTKNLEEGRKEGGDGVALLQMVRWQAAFWLARLRRMAGARTEAELGARNHFYGCMTMWRDIANSGRAFLIGEWALYVAKLYAVRPPQVTALDFDEWSPGPPDLDPKLFGILERALFETSARNQGQVMESVPKSREGIQANYLLAGLVRTRINLGLSERRRSALSDLAGKDSSSARRSQILQELPGAVRIAWSEGDWKQDLTGLVNRVDKYLIEGTKPVWQLPTPEREPSPSLAEDSPETNPEALFETQEAVRQELEERIKEHGLTPREAEVARLRFEGKETAEIAAALGTSASTVRVHEKNIKDKAPRDRAS